MKTSVIYIGLRADKNDKVHQCFLKGNKEVYFKGLKFLYIGDRYRAERTKDGLTMARKPENLGSANLDDKTLESYRMKEMAAEQIRATKRAHARAKRLQPSIWNKSLKEIHDMTNGLNVNETDAVIYLVRQMIFHGKKK